MSVAELARRARDAEPPALDEVAARRMIDRAVEAAPYIAAPAPRARMRWVPAAALALAAGIALGWWLHAQPPPRTAELSRIALPTGDQLVATQATRYELAKLEPRDRRVVLRAGTMLADVAHVARGQHFEIATPHLVAIATGTVFSVEADRERSHVRVYEGVVEVVQDGAHHLVAPGQAWSSDARLAVIAPRPRDLTLAIDEALERRSHDVTSVANAAPAIVPNPAATPTAATAPNPAATPVTAATAPNPAATPVTATAPTAAVASNAPTAITSNAAHVETARDPAPPAPAEPNASLDDLLASARAAVAAGKLDDALAICTRARQRGATGGAWLIVTADAQRGLGHATDAAATYERAAHELTGIDAFEAGYSAAYLRLKELKDPEAALSTLVTTRVDAEDSPLEERGLALHVRILVALHREADAKSIAQRYLARYPHGELRLEMQALAK